MSLLLDTDTVSEIRRGRDPKVAAWSDAVAPDQLFLSVLTLGEIRKGVERLRPRDPGQANVFDAWLADLQARFASRILAVTAEVADRWGRLNATTPRATIDSLIAATAGVHSLTVVTGNERDYRELGVPVFNPWS